MNSQRTLPLASTFLVAPPKAFRCEEAHIGGRRNKGRPRLANSVIHLLPYNFVGSLWEAWAAI